MLHMSMITFVAEIWKSKRILLVVQKIRVKFKNFKTSNWKMQMLLEHHLMQYENFPTTCNFHQEHWRTMLVEHYLFEMLDLFICHFRSTFAICPSTAICFVCLIIITVIIVVVSTPPKNKLRPALSLSLSLRRLDEQPMYSLTWSWPWIFLGRHVEGHFKFQSLICLISPPWLWLFCIIPFV